MVGKHISLMGNMDPYSDMCVGGKASLGICVRETRIPRKAYPCDTGHRYLRYFTERCIMRITRLV